MSLCALCFFIFLISPTFCSPIFDSEDVGKLSKTGKDVVITGHTSYPYMVYVEIFFTNENGKRRSQFCGGTIIGVDTVLTAGHCLYNKVDLKTSIYVGILDVKWEKETAQKLKMKDHLVHRDFKDECIVGDVYCYNLNDIGIIWTRKQFKFGPNVKIATLNRDPVKPVGEKGYILGWGRNEKNENPTMLQRGLVKVLKMADCKKFDPNLFYQSNIMCLSSVSGKTRACGGDSGGPFVIDGVVYGISAITLFSSSCSTNTMDLYTNVATYSDWIDVNLKLGSPKERTMEPPNKPSNEPSNKQSNKPSNKPSKKPSKPSNKSANTSTNKSSSKSANKSSNKDNKPGTSKI